MTREEAKRRIECCRNFLANNYSDMGEPNFTAFNMAIKALEQEPKTGWIPVSERLPEKSGLYLVSIGDLVTALSFCGNGFRTPFGSEYSVDAWQPLPEPYKESEERG